MSRIHQVQARGVGLGVQEEALDRRIVLEPLDTVTAINGRVADFELLECAREDVEEIAELGEDYGFGAWVVGAEPEDVAC